MKNNNVKDYSATVTSTQKVSQGFVEFIRSQLWGEHHYHPQHG